MLFLAALLAAADDAVLAEQRRAATHEMARRLGLPWRRLEPAAPRPGSRAILESLLPEVKGAEDAVAFCATVSLACPPWLDWTLLSPPLVFTDVPFKPGAHFASIRLPVASVHTPFDPILPWYFHAFRAEMRGRVTDFVSLLPFGNSGDFRWNREVDEVLDAWSSQTALRRILDWSIATRTSLASLTLPEAKAGADAWHFTLGTHQCDEAPRAGVPVARFQDGARIERLLARPELESEGEAMGHCVGSHHAGVEDGTTRIYSYRDADGMPQATWEVAGAYHEGGVGTELTELKGPDNEEVPGRGTQRRIQAWLAREGIRIGIDGDNVEADAQHDRLTSVLLWPEATRPKLQTDADRAADARQVALQGDHALSQARTRFEELDLALSLLEDGVRLQKQADDLRYSETFELDKIVTAFLEKDLTWTAASIVAVKADAAGWARLKAALEATGVASPERDESHLHYEVMFGAERLLKNAARRAALCEALEVANDTPVSVLDAGAFARLSDAHEDAYRVVKEVQRVLHAVTGLRFRMEHPDDQTLDGEGGTLAEGEYTPPDVDFGSYRLRIGIDATGDRTVRVTWRTDDGDEEESATGTSVLGVLWQANLLQTVVERREAQERGAVNLTQLGLLQALTPAQAHEAHIPTFLRAARAAGFPVPRATAKRFGA